MAVINKQQTLSLEVGGEIVISRPFDFEAMCLMNDKHSQGNCGKWTIAANALSYMFEGTKATTEVLKAANPTELANLCDRLWNMYVTELGKISKKKNADSPTAD